MVEFGDAEANFFGVFLTCVMEAGGPFRLDKISLTGTLPLAWP